MGECGEGGGCGGLLGDHMIFRVTEEGSVVATECKRGIMENRLLISYQ